MKEQPYPQYPSTTRLSFIHEPSDPRVLKRAAITPSSSTSPYVGPSALSVIKPYSVNKVGLECAPYFRKSSVLDGVVAIEGESRTNLSPKFLLDDGAVFHNSASIGLGMVYGGWGLWLAKSRIGQSVMLSGSERDLVRR